MNYIIASGPVIIESEKVLLNKDADDAFWKFPGGKWELYDFSDWNNSLEEVARREVMEELGIEIDIIRPLKPMMVKMGNNLVVLIHWLSTRRGDVVKSGDTTEWAWHDIFALPNDCAPNIKAVVEDYLRSL